LYASVFQIGERMEATQVADEPQVSPVGEMVKKRDSAERVDSRHAS
jgi:hypothetical protein